MSKDKEKLARFGVGMPEGLLNQFDTLIDRNNLPNRSVALRHLVREYITTNRWQSGSGVVCGSMTIMYDHHGNDITNGLTMLQHDFGDEIICTTHVHISHDICMECLIVKGNAIRLRRLEAKLKAMKGIHSVHSAIVLAE